MLSLSRLDPDENFKFRRITLELVRRCTQLAQQETAKDKDVNVQFKHSSERIGKTCKT